ncbi:MAG: HDIG domain-containing protein [Bacteroidales bacterium]|jgi:uncharacterized protein|nr:HDIG domain-containing protein [Bacteroidales bacterium]
MNDSHIIELIHKYFPPEGQAFSYYLAHVTAVRRVALQVVKHHPQLRVNVGLIAAGAMLHDIGICKVHAPEIGCYGEHPYLAHGYLGRQILEYEGYNDLALIAERHTGVGISRKEIISSNLALPHRDLVPESMEEWIVCYADCFFSKTNQNPSKPKSLDKIRASMLKYGADKLDVFDGIHRAFGSDYIYLDDSDG